MLKNPQNLYDICIGNVVADCATTMCTFFKKEFRNLPNNVLFDFYHKMFLDDHLCLLALEFSELEVFNRILCVKHQRRKLLEIFQSLINYGTNVPQDLVHNYAKYNSVSDLRNTNVIDIGLRIGEFFNEVGCFNYSIRIFNVIEDICKKLKQDVFVLRRLLDCYRKRIYAEAVYCEFRAAEKTFKSAQETIEKLEKFNSVPNLAGLYTNFSRLYFIRSEYDEALSWSKKALKLLTDDLPSRTIIEVLRQASKACVVKRSFNQAGLLIHQAVNLASNLYTLNNHPHFSDTLLDYGYYLLDFGSIQESIKIYKKALNIRMEVFGEHNIHVALGHESLAYALYVNTNESISGSFHDARENAERSIYIMQKILPKDHLMLASIKRVKALVLEEVALNYCRPLQDEYLSKAEQLHEAALSLCYKAFGGEKNVQMARHYDNLGRLYQTMRQYKEAEKMHLCAIAIKEELLGKDDYEVGLSICYLASLYSFRMERYTDAEKLYLRSLEIDLNLFGEAYSGLEYDYRSLIHVYSKLSNANMVNHYTHKMEQWESLRDKIKPIVYKEELQPLKVIIDKFFSMC